MSLTKVTYSMINGAVNNVLDYGAVGDGVADDTAAIQAAMTDSLTSGKSVYFPSGSYLVTSTIIVTPNINVYGESSISSIVKTTMDAPIFQLGNDGDFFQHLVLSDLNIQGSGDAAKTNQHAIYANSGPTTAWVAYSVFERLRISNFGGNTFKFLGYSGGGLINNVFSDIRITLCKADIMRIEGFSSANTFNHVSFQDSSFSGVSWVNYVACQNTVFNQCAFESLGLDAGASAAYGVYADVQTGGGGPQLTFNSCYFETIGGSNDGAGVYLESPIDLFVNGGVFAALPNAVWVNGSETNIVIDGGYFLANTNITRATINSFFKFTNSNVSSRLNIRSIGLFQVIGGVLGTADYVQFSSWLGQKNGILTFNTQLPTTLTGNLQQKIIAQTSLALNADVSTGINADTQAGFLTVFNQTTGRSAVFYFSNALLGLVIDTGVATGGSASFSITKNTASLVNVYVESNLIKVQNYTAANPLEWALTYTEYLT